MENPSSRILRRGAEKIPSEGLGQIRRYTSRASMWRLENWLFEEDVERGTLLVEGGRGNEEEKGGEVESWRNASYQKEIEDRMRSERPVRGERNGGALGRVRERRLELYQEGDGEGCPPGRTRERRVTYGEE